MRAYVSFLLFALVTALLVPISASAQTAVACFGVYDALGERVGSADSAEQNAFGEAPKEIHVFLSDQGQAIRLEVDRDSLIGTSRPVFFDEEGCTGNAFLERTSGIFPFARIDGSELWYPDTSVTPTAIDVVSAIQNGCENGLNHAVPDAVPARNITLSFTPPFDVKVEPCFIPPEPDPEQIIIACVKNKGGAMRMVADPADCTSRETPISWVANN